MAAALVGGALWLGAAAVPAVEVQNLDGLEDIFGRYAPGGDCSRKPQIVVDRSGIAFEGAGPAEKVGNVEYAASHGGNFYEGITKWIFPFRSAGGYPILMAFHADERKGALAITPHDEGWQGGPKLSPRNQALVAGSPYARCR